ncbi:hypothetical protein B7R87_11975 [Streptomyces tsukubensis]|nr:hypothetical protein B7R87_11975 [Streptomyces tsukubensis]
MPSAPAAPWSIGPEPRSDDRARRGTHEEHPGQGAGDRRCRTGPGSRRGPRAGARARDRGRRRPVRRLRRAAQHLRGGRGVRLRGDGALLRLGPRLRLGHGHHVRRRFRRRRGHPLTAGAVAHRRGSTGLPGRWSPSACPAPGRQRLASERITLDEWRVHWCVNHASASRF